MEEYYALSGRHVADRLAKLPVVNVAWKLGTGISNLLGTCARAANVPFKATLKKA
jgi:hypothetical protein